MTFVSLIVALVYENLVGSIVAHGVSWPTTSFDVLFWVQCLVVATTPLMYWFTTSIVSASIRIAFSPRDTLLVILPGPVFMMLAASIGSSGTELVWAFAASLLYGSAWLVFREYERLYTLDDEATHIVGPHLVSRRLMLSAGTFMTACTLLVYIDVVPIDVISVALVSSMLAAIYAHTIWYREWRLIAGITQK